MLQIYVWHLWYKLACNLFQLQVLYFQLCTANCSHKFTSSWPQLCSQCSLRSMPVVSKEAQSKHVMLPCFSFSPVEILQVALMHICEVKLIFESLSQPLTFMLRWCTSLQFNFKRPHWVGPFVFRSYEATCSHDEATCRSSQTTCEEETCMLLERDEGNNFNNDYLWWTKLRFTFSPCVSLRLNDCESSWYTAMVNSEQRLVIWFIRIYVEAVVPKPGHDRSHIFCFCQCFSNLFHAETNSHSHAGTMLRFCSRELLSCFYATSQPHILFWDIIILDG